MSSTPVNQAPSRLWRFLAMLLALAALVMSLILLRASWSHGSVAGCAPGSGCDKVLSSSWAYWLDLPVSLPSSVVYLIALAALVHVGAGAPLKRRRTAWAILLTLAGVIAGAAVWFILLQWLAIQAFCVLCVSTHLIGLALAVMIASWLLGPGHHHEASLRLSPNGRDARTIGLASITLLAILIVGQSLASPLQGRVMNAVGLLDTGPGPQRRMTLLAPVDPKQYSVLGSHDAPYLLLYFFDYACPHCRIMHQHLDQVRQRYGTQVGVLLVPVPLNAQCNPSVQETDPGYEDSCQLARLSLAVWRSQPAQFSSFHHRLMAGDRAPSAQTAHQWAVELIGEPALKKALDDPWVAWRLTRHAAMYEAFSIERLPTLVIGKRMLMGRLGTSEELLQLIEQELSLKPQAK